jgi:hypothetical protein
MYVKRERRHRQTDDEVRHKNHPMIGSSAVTTERVAAGDCEETLADMINS